MKLTSLFLAVYLVLRVFSAAPPLSSPTSACARDPAAIDSRIFRRGCVPCYQSNCPITRRDSDDSPDGSPLSITDPRPGHSDPASPNHIFGSTAAKCEKWDPPYGCGKNGHCWRACGWWPQHWCWIALDNGLGPWQQCTKAEDCKKGKVEHAECCQCQRHSSCGCGC